MDEKQLLGRISELVEEEHRLRDRVQRGEISSAEETTRLKQLEEALDQCWDLLRRRRAAREAGGDPDQVGPAPISQVEGYLQ